MNKLFFLSTTQKELFCFVFALLLYVANLYAQDEERNDVDTSNFKTLGNNGAQIVKLKKSYIIGDGITLRSSNGYFSINPTLQTLFELNTLNNNLSNPTSSFSIARARITVVANLFDKKINLITRLNLPSNNQSVTTGNRSFNNTLQEAYIEYRPSIEHTFNIGLRADYLDTRELRCQGENLGFITRSLVSEAFDAIFDYGIRYKGNYKLGGKHLLRPYASITTGDSRSSIQKNFGGLRYGIRLDYLPFDKFSQGGEFYWDDVYREEKPKLVVGVVYNYNDGASSAVGTNGGRWQYGNTTQQIILPTTSRFIVDYLFKYNGFYSLGSYSATTASVPQGIAGEFRLNGSFSAYSNTQTQEQTKNIVLSRLNIGSGYSFQSGYVFPSDVALAFRYATLTQDANAAAFANFNQSYTLVATKYFYKHNLKIQAQIGYDKLQANLATPNSSGNYSAMLMTTIQL
jgi:phosphate-selective porin OprO and OprP